MSSPVVEPRERASVRRLAPVRLVVFVCVLLAGVVAAQLIRRWTLRHVPLRTADWVAIPLAVALGAALIGLYIVLVRLLEHRRAAEARPGAGAAATGVALGL